MSSYHFGEDAGLGQVVALVGPGTTSAEPSEFWEYLRHVDTRFSSMTSARCIMLSPPEPDYGVFGTLISTERRRYASSAVRAILQGWVGMATLQDPLPPDFDLGNYSTASVVLRGTPSRLSLAELDPWPCFDVPDEAVQQLVDRVMSLLKENSVEDGVTHPGEALVVAFAERWDESADSALRTYILGCRDAGLSLSLILLLARAGIPRGIEGRRALIEDALRRTTTDSKLVAIEAVELYGDADLAETLRWTEPNRPWVERYRDQVLRDLMR